MPASHSTGLDSIDVFLSPQKAIQRMLSIIHRDGEVAALTDRAFQATRESWVAAVFLLGYGQITNDTYWLRENPIANDAPDVFGISIHALEDRRGASKEVIEIEVKEYDNHVDVDLLTHLQRLATNTAYHPDTFLVCYAHAGGRSTTIAHLIDGLRNIQTSVREIWILMTEQGSAPGSFMIARVYLRDATSLEQLTLLSRGNWYDLMQIPQGDMLQTTRGLSDGVEFTHLGVGVIELPARR